MCEKVSFRVFKDSLIRLTNMDYSVGDYDRLLMESLHF